VKNAEGRIERDGKEEASVETQIYFSLERIFLVSSPIHQYKNVTTDT
jgi:hypothetical protein